MIMNYDSFALLFGICILSITVNWNNEQELRAMIVGKQEMLPRSLGIICLRGVIRSIFFQPN